MDWKQRWIDGATAWDLGSPHPLTRGLINEARSLSGENISGRWLIPGCGRAHDVTEIVGQGADFVVGVDLSDVAIAEARKCYGALSNVAFEAGDVMNPEAQSKSVFSGIFDRAMMCALSGTERLDYLRACYLYLRPGGLFVSLPFARVARPENGPPFQMSEVEIQNAFRDGWEILRLKPVVSAACDQKILGEWELIARKVPA